MSFLAAVNVSATDELTKKIFGFDIDLNDLWSAVLAGVIVCAFGLYVARKATSGVPSKVQILWETIVGGVSDQVERMLGPEGRPVVPLAITLFAYILTCNWLEVFFWTGHNTSLVPTPTSNVNIDYMMAIVVFLYCNYTAIRTAGLGKYLKHFVSPWPMTPLNVVEEISKPVSLSLRLFGNVFSGALIFALLSGLFAHIYVPIAIIDVIWLPFDLAVFVIQAFIFALLTVIYYQQALQVSHGGH